MLFEHINIDIELTSNNTVPALLQYSQWVGWRSLEQWINVSTENTVGTTELKQGNVIQESSQYIISKKYTMYRFNDKKNNGRDS